MSTFRFTLRKKKKTNQKFGSRLTDRIFQWTVEGIDNSRGPVIFPMVLVHSFP